LNIQIKKRLIIAKSFLKRVTIRLFEIELKLPDKTRTLDLSKMQLEDLKKIKEKFEDTRRVKNEAIAE
jgi:hypothetical protein